MTLIKLTTPPEQRGYTIGENSAYRFSDLGGGAPLVSGIKKNNWNPVKVTFLYNKEEYKKFRSFYVGKLKGGLIPFKIDLFLGSHEIKEYIAKFQPDGFSMRPEGDSFFLVTHNLLVKPRLDDNDNGAYALEYEAKRRRTALTFGAFPLVIEGDTFNATSIKLESGALNSIPQPETDYFSTGGALVGGSLLTTVVYKTHELHDIDTFVAGANGLVGGSLLTTVVYKNHEIYDIDSFTSTVNGLVGGSLLITVYYATHDLYDTDTFTAGASGLVGGSLRII